MKVFIHADMAFRTKRIVEVYGEREQSPEERLRDKDKHRVLHQHEVGSRPELPPDAGQRRYRHRQVRGHHRGAVLR